MVSLSDLSRPLVAPPSSIDAGAVDTLVDSSRQLLKYVYWVVGLGSLTMFCFILFNTYNRQVAAVLIFMGGLLAIYFHYIKWFMLKQDPSWPTGQSLCPDYLTPVSPGFQTNFDGSPKPSGTGSFKCIDFVGVSTNGALLKASPSNVEMALRDSRYHVEITPNMKQGDLVAMLKAKGLTWIAMFSDDN
jgi:hypothetical protein